MIRQISVLTALMIAASPALAQTATSTTQTTETNAAVQGQAQPGAATPSNDTNTAAQGQAQTGTATQSVDTTAPTQGETPTGTTAENHRRQRSRPVRHPSTDTTGAAQGQVRPKPEGDTGSTNTGGVTTTGQENLPDVGATTGVNAASGNPPQPGSGPAQTVVDPGIVKEIRDAALAAQKATATPPPQKTEEQKQAEAAAIARHRDAFLARVKERLQALPQG